MPGYELETIALALPEEQLLELVLAIVDTHNSIQFVREMLQLLGETRRGRITQHSEDSRIQIIIDATKCALAEHQQASRCTPFFAGMYAYENSRDHLLSMLGYFDFCQQCRVYDQEYH